MQGTKEDINYSELRAKLTPLAGRLTSNAQDREDLLQDTLIKVLSKNSQWDRSRSLVNWASTTLVRTWLDTVRSRKRRVTTVSFNVKIETEEGDVCPDYADETIDIEAEVVSRLYTQQILEEMKQSSPLSKHIPVLLLLAEDADYATISASLDIPVSTVRSRVYRLRVLSQRFLDEQKVAA